MCGEELKKFLKDSGQDSLSKALEKNGFNTLDKLKVILNHKDVIYHLTDINAFDALVLYDNLQKYVRDDENRPKDMSVVNDSTSIEGDSSQGDDNSNEEEIDQGELNYVAASHIVEQGGGKLKPTYAGISKGALIRAALKDDSAAEENEELNQYNSMIYSMILELFEQKKWQGSGGLTACWKTDATQAFNNRLQAQKICKHSSIKKFYKSFGAFGTLNEKTTLKRIGVRMTEHRRKLKLQLQGKIGMSYLGQTSCLDDGNKQELVDPSEKGTEFADSQIGKRRRRTSTPKRRKIIDLEDKMDSIIDSQVESSSSINNSANNSSDSSNEFEHPSEDNEQNEYLKLRKKNMDEQEMFMVEHGLPIPGDKGRLISMMYFKLKDIKLIDYELLKLVANKLKVEYNTKFHDKETVMGKVGDALYKQEIASKVDAGTVIARTNIEIASRDILEQCKKELKSKKDKTQQRREKRN